MLLEKTRHFNAFMRLNLVLYILATLRQCGFLDLFYFRIRWHCCDFSSDDRFYWVQALKWTWEHLWLLHIRWTKVTAELPSLFDCFLSILYCDKTWFIVSITSLPGWYALVCSSLGAILPLWRQRLLKLRLKFGWSSILDCHTFDIYCRIQLLVYILRMHLG